MTATRVLFVECNEDGTVGGSHQVLYDMVRAFDRSIVDPVVLFYQDNRFADALRASGMPVHVWETERRSEIAARQNGGKAGLLVSMLAEIRRRRAFLERERIDLVHLNNSPFVGHDDWLPAARLRRIPIVTSARGDATARLGASLLHRLQWMLVRRFDRVLCVSQYIAAAMRAHGIADERVRVVHDGVDRSKLSRQVRPAADLRRELGVPDGRLLVSMIGNIREWKGQHVLLEALTLVPPATRERLFVMLVGAMGSGDDVYSNRLRAQIASSGLEGVVSMVGPRGDIPDVMASSDIVVHSSILAEPGGTVVIEAMTFGAPVIAADRGGHLDYFLPGLGLVHDVSRPEQLAGHLTRLANDPDERARMVRLSRERALEFSIDATARKMEQVYLELRGRK